MIDHVFWKRLPYKNLWHLWALAIMWSGRASKGCNCCPPWFSLEVRRYWWGPPVTTRCGSCGYPWNKLRDKLGHAVVRTACLPYAGQVMSAWTAKCRTVVSGWLKRCGSCTTLGCGWTNHPKPSKTIQNHPMVHTVPVTTGDNSKLIGCHSAIRDSAVRDLKYVWCASMKFVQSQGG